MTHSLVATDLVAEFEGFRLNAYQDGNGVWTIGFGHTESVTEGDVCTESMAMDWLSADLGIADNAIARLVTVSLTQPQWDALTSFVYNIGQGNFAKSTCLADLNHGLYANAADEMLEWNKISRKVSAGLINRRTAERALFLKGT